LSTAFEIAKKISFQKQKSYTRFIVRLSIAATAISVTAIILTLSIVNGFQESIANKVYHFWGHIRVSTVNGLPISIADSTQKLMPPSVEKIIPFSNQSAVLSYQQDIDGVVAKGFPSNHSIPFLIKGHGFTQYKDSIKNQIIISDALASKLNIPLDSSIRLYFLNNGSIQLRKMKVIGWYHSGIEEYDRQFVMVDLNMLQQLSLDKENIEGYSIELKKGVEIDKATNEIQSKLPANWVATSIHDYYPQIFDWIGVQTVNRNVTITILLIIAIVNLLTCLFILMLERVAMIGTLTALGATHHLIRQVFLYQASFICWTGIVIGTILGIGLSLLQQYFGWIQLDEAAYFIKTLPISINPIQIGWVIIGTAIISYLSFLAPTIWIKKIAPAKAIKFD
jgi:lipoprotein-releasing system permease protein